MAHHQARLRTGLLTRGYDADFAERLIEQINGFGEYGFPESHAASFALLVYVSAWLKCHEPAAFCCALLNSQPMGFYSPAQLVQDARRHGVKVLPVDVSCSRWDHTLEPQPGHPQPALRLGFRLLKQVTESIVKRIIDARETGPFLSVQDFARRTGLSAHELDGLAHGNALASLSRHRYQSRWDILALQRDSPLIQDALMADDGILRPPPEEGQDTVEDYASMGLSLGRHPLAQLRSHPVLAGCRPHRELMEIPHRGFIRTAGIVTCRQRPGTATGVVFLTLEDETGSSNIVVWRDVVERFRREVVHGRLLKIKGVVERQGRVTHVIAGHIEDISPVLETLAVRSRDFH